MIRAAFDCSIFRKGEIGGTEGFLLNLLDGLHEAAPDDIELTLFVLSSQVESFERFTPRFKIRTLAVTGIVGRVLWQNLVLPFYSLSYDVVLFAANVRPFLLFAKSITVIHDLQYRFFPEFWPRGDLWYRKLLVPMSIRRSDHVATISETVGDQIRSEFGREDVAICHQAISMEPLPETEPLKDIPEPFFLVPSILAPHKNIENLVLACRRISEGEGLPFVVFIGAYQAANFPYELPADRGRVLGYVDRDLRDQLFARCTAMILPSVYEGFGMPYAEALLLGRPVIACDIPIAHEVLGDEAIFIKPPFGPDEIVAAIQEFLRDGKGPASAAVVERLRARTQPRTVAERYLALIRGLME